MKKRQQAKLWVIRKRDGTLRQFEHANCWPTKEMAKLANIYNEELVTVETETLR